MQDAAAVNCSPGYSGDVTVVLGRRIEVAMPGIIE